MAVTSALRLACVTLAVGACSGNKRPPAVEDATHAGSARDAPAAHDGSGAAPAVAVASGDVQVRVTWTDVPRAARASPGKTACGTPRAPAVSPTTTWGIPDVLVILEGGPPPVGEARIRLADCALAPRVAIGGALVVDSAADRPARLALRAAGTDTDLHALEGTATRPIQLPIAGHAVTTPLPPGSVHELRYADESSWIVAGPGVVTDRGGVAMLRDVPVGTHTVRAWLPPRAGQPARHATGEVAVADGDLAELSLELAP